MRTDDDNLVQIVTTCVTGKGGDAARAICCMVPKDLLNKLYAVYDEIVGFADHSSDNSSGHSKKR